jgi:hypothetical protein
MRWIAPWALDALRNADFYELDASFKAIRSYVYCVPLAIIRNVGVPLGLVVGPSESEEMFASFADGLIAKGMERECLHAIALLSDEGKALLAYGRRYHAVHFACFRHWLESLGLRTLAALLGRRLLFTRTEAAYNAMLAQTLSDFAAACRAGEVTAKAQTKFASIFGVVLPLPIDPCMIPEVRRGKFIQQALWGPRGERGVSACSNHAEGLHGRLNRVTSPHRSTLGRLAAVLQILKKKVMKFPQSAMKAQHRIATDLMKSAKELHYSETTECPGAMCDHGTLLSRRFGSPLPCIHTVLRHPIPVAAAPEPIPILTGTTLRRVPYQGTWGAAPARKKMQRSFLLLNEAIADPFATPQADLEETRFIQSVMRELSVTTGVKQVTRFDQAHLLLGRILGRLEAQHPEIPEAELQRAAQSEFLVQYWKGRQKAQ